MTLLADGGITAGVYAQSGKAWNDKKQLGKVIATGLELRKKFALVSLLISVPILLYLLRHHGASWLMAIMIGISLIPAFLANLSSAIFIIVPKIQQDIPPILRNDVEVGIGRLILTFSLIFIFPFTFIALLANGLPRIYGNFKLKKIASPYLSRQKQSKKIRQQLYRTVKRMFPGVVYYCFSGQIMLWLISFLGNTTALAQLGALARIAVVLSLITSLSQTLVIPRYARLEEIKKKLLKYYFQIFASFLLIVILFISIGYFFSEQILWVLGENYFGLHMELLLVLIGGGLSLLSGIFFELNLSRDWIINPIISISLSVGAIIFGAIFLDLSDLKGVLVFNIFLALTQLLINALYGLLKIKRLEVA
ncbi:hypothetical protein [Christiangramia echinicola]|uniref:hypothetical protein n=1 Tax=Christiangramia echinicola TaxID=279359 RepID=UPI00040D4084|nr:hypothetical protein [Christiangramia echinicola]